MDLDQHLSPMGNGRCVSYFKTGFPHTLENSGKWPFHEKSGKSQGISQAPQEILENSKMSGNSQGILAMADLNDVSEKY